MSDPSNQHGDRLRAAALAAMRDQSQEPAVQPRLRLYPGGKTNVRIVSALLRCTSCKAEWHANINNAGAVLAHSAKCPRCAENTPPAA